MNAVVSQFTRFSAYLKSLYLLAFSDRRIARYLAELYESRLAPADAEGLRFYVRSRTVTIYGTLYHPVVHQRVLRVTSRVFGVKAIIDRMHVVRDVQAEEPPAVGSRVFQLKDPISTRRFLPA